jgi:hypothetical protein
MGYRIENMEYRDAHKALLSIVYRLLQQPQATAIMRAEDEDAANELNAMLQDAVDRIKIEFDSSEDGPNPLWTPSKLTKDNGRVVLAGPYDSTVHTHGFIAEK